MNAHEPLNQLLEALREGEEARRSLEAALAREKGLQERLGRLERALGPSPQRWRRAGGDWV